MNNDLVLARRYTNHKAYEVFDYLDISEATRADYRARLLPFINFIETNQLNINAFLSFKRELASRTDLSVSSKNKHLTVARIFLRELARQGIMPMDITHNVKSFRQDKRHHQQGVTDDEIQRLVDWCTAYADKYREVAILCLAIYQGLREIEICRLDWEHIDFRNGIAWIHGKGRDDKELIYLHPQTKKALRRLYDAQGHYARRTGAVFKSRSIKSKDGRLTTRGLRYLIKTIFDLMLIDRKVHGLRHWFTTRLLKEYEGNLVKVAGYTRHRSTQMVEIYNDEVIQEADLPRFFGAFKDIKLVHSTS